ncbi:hypothetical protein Q8A67_005297 [Cirrhinus molitorella]|uniref:Ig-like domain-containing protein n=1 Tax=Cirrhinus molitorella TaxID=172907 RepID=A0AA88Q6S4_9TELE|nr:hypothetical protein Q8A67_005297 [Cirrhinus molitorella]
MYKVTGYSGSGLMIKCEHPQYKTKPKYICKESDGCSERKSPGVQDEWMKNGDVSLYDDTRAGVLMVFFRELKAADAGTYRCGVNVSHYTEIFTELQLNVKHDAKYSKNMTESAHLDEEVSITCQIPEEHEVHFCKEDDNHICQNISSSKVTQMSGSSERNEERVFTVSISNVSVRDAGVYWCGAETRDTYLTFISLTTKIQLNIIMPPVVRHEGESAEIICPYDSIYKSKPKSLCKGKCSTRDRNTLSETVREEKETKTDRLTLNDNVTASVFTGTITGLTAEDAGKYWCAVTLERDLNYLYTHLMVIMNEELNLTKYEGDDVSIQCKHHDEDQKSFCKAHEASMCVKDGDSLETIRDDRFSFSDEASTGVFTVNITDLREEDSGIYWCGVHATTKVHLNVKKVPPVVRHEGESAEIICPYDSIYKSKPKSLCKGKCSTRDRNTLSETVREEKETKTDRLTLNDNVTASVFTGTITGLTAEDAGKYWCAVTLERGLNYLYTHLMVIMNEELNLTKYEGDDVSIQCKHHDEDQKSFCKAHEASVCVKDGDSLETIRDDRFSFSDEASTGVFTVNITDLREEDSGIYWCGAHFITKVHLNIDKKRDFFKIIIICVCVTMLLIGGFTLTVCKIRHKRKSLKIWQVDERKIYNDSRPDSLSDPGSVQTNSHGDLSIISSDGLLYTAVSFQKHGQLPSDTTAGLSKDEIDTDYTTVVCH